MVPGGWYVPADTRAALSTAGSWRRAAHAVSACNVTGEPCEAVPAEQEMISWHLPPHTAAALKAARELLGTDQR
jgi:hypothetical protein